MKGREGGIESELGSFEVLMGKEQRFGEKG